MASVELRLEIPTKEAVEYIAGHLREVDKRELGDTGDLDAPGALIRAFDEGEVVLVAYRASSPIAALCVSNKLYGETSLTQKRYCWLKGTDEIAKTGVGGMLKALYNVGKILKIYGHLYTYVRDDNQKAQRFVQALGFTTNGSKALFNGHPATYYERIK